MSEIRDLLETYANDKGYVTTDEAYVFLLGHSFQVTRQSVSSLLKTFVDEGKAIPLSSKIYEMV